MLTDLSIRKMPVPTTRREIPDGKISGLYLVCQPSGARSWALRYRVDGKPAKLTIGSYPTIDLAAARRLAQKATAEVAEGNDPAAQKKAAREAVRDAREATADRVERVVELFVERYAKPKNRDWRETQRILDREVAGRWKGRRLSQITRAHVHEMLDEIVDRAPIRANRTLAHFRRMVRWAIERGIIERSPVEGVKAPAAEASRDRVLSDAEIKLIWMAFESIGWPFGPIGKQGNRIWNSAATLAGFCVLNEMDSTGSRMIRGAGEGGWIGLSNAGTVWTTRAPAMRRCTTFMRFWR